MFNGPNQNQIEHADKLVQVIRGKINDSGGWINFEEFMALALYAPGMGYYSAGSIKFGESGDFITAPLLGNLFARCLAKQCIEIIKNLPSDQPTTIVEFGAGTGQLALDILTHMEALGHFPDQYLIIEPSTDLKQRQKNLIEDSRAEYLESVKWLGSLPEEGITGIIIANEVLDAFPVLRFQIDENGQACELGVSLNEEQFVWKVSPQPLSPVLLEKLRQYSLPTGYQGEINRHAEGWVRSVGDSLNAGAMILIDYGYPGAEYYHWDRVQGTLMCHYQHHAHGDPFFYPGTQDITSHVDFSAIADAGCDVGMRVQGFCSQGCFLLSLGLLEIFEEIQRSVHTSKDLISLSQEVKKLTLPHEMGELFKVISLAKNYPHPLSGFSMQNNSGRL